MSPVPSSSEPDPSAARVDDLPAARPHDLLVAVRPPERLPWSAILAGSLAGFAPLALLIALGTGLGLLAPVADLGAGGVVWIAVTAFVALFVAGFTTARLAGATTRRRGALYGLLSSSALAAFCAWLLAGGLAGCASFTSTPVVRPVLGPEPRQDDAAASTPAAPSEQQRESEEPPLAAPADRTATSPGGVPPGEVPPFAAVPPPLIPEIAPPTLPPTADGEEAEAPPVPPIPPPPPTDVVPMFEEEPAPASDDAGDDATLSPPAPAGTGSDGAPPAEPAPAEDTPPAADDAGGAEVPPATLRPLAASTTSPATDAGATPPPARAEGADAQRLGVAWFVGLLSGVAAAALGGSVGLGRRRDRRVEERSTRPEPPRMEPARETVAAASGPARGVASAPRDVSTARPPSP